MFRGEDMHDNFFWVNSGRKIAISFSGDRGKGEGKKES
jgi:hypothetical protein